MSKVKIKIVFLGHVPHSIDIEKIIKWKSEIFEILKPINTVAIVGNSDGENWEFSDQNIDEQLPERESADVLLAVTNVPLQNNYYIRGLKDNKACMTYEMMADILKLDNIPLENLLLRMLYFISLAYKHYGGQIPISGENISIIHHETKGCIFDMNGVKTDVIYSLNGPQICHSCVEKLTTKPRYKIEKEVIDKVQSELKKVKKGIYYQITDFIKRKPVLAIIISSFLAIVLGTIGSIIAILIWEKLLK